MDTNDRLTPLRVALVAVGDYAEVCHPAVDSSCGNDRDLLGEINPGFQHGLVGA